jgi:hypothetical protein
LRTHVGVVEALEFRFQNLDENVSALLLLFSNPKIRKKFLLESLQQQLNGLRSENTGLRSVVKQELPDATWLNVPELKPHVVLDAISKA